MNTLETLGHRIRCARGAVPQKDFAERFGINQNTLSRYERDERTPDADFIKIFCEKSDIRPEWLLFGTGSMSAPAQHADKDVSRLTGTAESAPAPLDAHCACTRCARLEARLDDVERERRELTAENRHLWKENGELREKCARLEERQCQRHGGLDGGKTVVSV